MKDKTMKRGWFKFSNNDCTNLEKLRENFFTIKRKTSEILLPYDDVSYIKNPSVDIDTIARKNGITDIIPVSSKELHYEHANLYGSVIKINKMDSNKEQRFSIAHDLKHFLLEEKDLWGESDFSKKSNSYNKAPQVQEAQRLVARYAKKYKSIIRKRYERLFKIISKYVAACVSNIFGKPVSDKKALQVLEKIYFSDCYSNSEAKVPDKRLDKLFIKEAVINAANRLYHEEMADYFAANLLVPTERFLLWEKKPDWIIARAFKVPTNCIKKRRAEIKNEVDFLTIKELSSGDNIE